MDNWKSSKGTQKTLHDFKQEMARAPPDIKEAKAYNDHIMDKIDSGMKERGWNYRNEYTGSSYEGTKVNSGNEFDVMKVQRRNDLQVKPVDSPFVKLQSSDNTCLSTDDYKSKFTGDIQKTINADSELRQQVKPIAHGPAVQLDISKPGGGFSHSTDVVFGIESQGTIATAKGGKDPSHWRKSTSLQEKADLKNSDKQTLRTLKAMREVDPPLQGLDTYHFKNAVLTQSQTAGYEHQTATERATGTMGYMKECIAKGHLPKYNDPTVNLLEGKSDIQLENVGNRLGNLSVSENKFKNVLQRSNDEHQ